MDGIVTMEWVYTGRRGRMRSIGFVLSLLLALMGDRALAQETPLSPSETYKAALAPFNAAKAQPDDLTDAEDRKSVV